MAFIEPSVTILVTVKNSAGTIKKCIDSILNLNYKNKKVYVTDAYSTDGTWEILKKYGKRIRLDRIKGNIAVGHNYMIKRSNTEFISFTDADCVVDRNWLKRLIEVFKTDEIVASGGMVKTPSGVNKLQQLVGRELEHRFSEMPYQVERLPTISLCVRTKIAKKILFDKDLDVAQETDWGYRVTKLGKMIFVPNSVVYHYHRATWKNYFKQQYVYAKFAFSLFFLKKHKNRMFGDRITKAYVPFQIIMVYLTVLFLLLSIFNSQSLFLSSLSLLIILLTYFVHALILSKTPYEFLFYILIFAVRNVAWCLGLLRGIFIKFK